MGFEPTHALHIGLAGQRLKPLGQSVYFLKHVIKKIRCSLDICHFINQRNNILVKKNIYEAITLLCIFISIISANPNKILTTQLLFSLNNRAMLILKNLNVSAIY